MRGMKKWLPFKSLKGQYEELEKMKKERAKVEKPVLSEDEEEEVNRFLIGLKRGEKTKGRYKNMKNYELMYILMPNLEEDAIKAEIEALHKIITDNGGKITGVNAWGMRDLAYEIKKQTKGYYVVTEMSCEPEVIAKFNKIVLLDSKVMRFLITVAHK